MSQSGMDKQQRAALEAGDKRKVISHIAAESFNTRYTMIHVCG